ncbi:MAG: hypothetical protein ACE5FM_01895 [Methyloligellaceae bacterium]
MTQDQNAQLNLAWLETVLDTFGSDPNRWPAHERGALEALIETNADARRLLGEALALARVMEAAPASKASASLKSRITTAINEDTGRGARIVPLQAALTRSMNSLYARSRGRAMWSAAALAASFAFGLYLGVAGIGGTAVDGAFRIAVDGTSGSNAGSISWLEDDAGADEEEPL